MIDYRGISSRGTSKTNSHTLRNFHRAYEIKESFCMGCKISYTLRTKFAHQAKIRQPLRNQFTHPTKFSQTMRKISRTQTNFTHVRNQRSMRSNFAHCAKPKRHLRKWRVSYPFLFKPPLPPISSFPHFANTKHPANPSFSSATLQSHPSPFDSKPCEHLI